MTCVPRVAIIIVNWNGKADTLECLASLAADTYPRKRVFVVDNGSTDGSVAAIHAAFPNVTVIETGRNFGFTGGNNVGIERSLQDKPDYVYLLNNDTTSEPDALSRLVDAAEKDATLGVLTPIINYFERKDEPWFAGSTIDLRRGVAVHDNTQYPRAPGSVPELAWASGCAMLIRRDLLARLKGFDDRFFLIWEDVDLSLRARECGARIGLVPSAKIYHKVSRSFQSISVDACYYYLRNNLLVVRRHGGGGSIRVVLARVRDALRMIRRGQAGGWSQLAAIAAACRDFHLGRFGPRGFHG